MSTLGQAVLCALAPPIPLLHTIPVRIFFFFHFLFGGLTIRSDSKKNEQIVLYSAFVFGAQPVHNALKAMNDLLMICT
jgi:hypothetical protein